MAREIAQLHQQCRGTCGSPKAHVVQKNRGDRGGKKRAEHLMCANGLVGCVIQVTRLKPGLKHFNADGDNLLRKEPKPTKPNQVSVVDFSHLKLDGNRAK